MGEVNEKSVVVDVVCLSVELFRVVDEGLA